MKDGINLMQFGLQLIYIPQRIHCLLYPQQ